MSELEALMTLHGAIDDAVVQDPSKAEIVGRYYGPYQDGGAVGWFGEFRQWTADLTGVPANDVLPTGAAALEGAIGELASLSPSPYMQARRMLAVAVAARVLDSSMLDDVVNLAPALGPGIGVNNLDLLSLLRNDSHFFTASQWVSMTELALVDHLVSALFVLHNPMFPCAGNLVTVKLPGSNVEVATLTTDFCPSLTFDQAVRVLDPAGWPACNPLWCELTKTRTSAAGNPIYHEQVSLDCVRKPHTWTADCDLEFVKFEAPDVRIISYDLADPPQPGDPIQVDSGSLEVREVGGRVCVHTTKRIRFNYPFTGTSLAMVACALGYGPVAAALVFCCAGVDANGPDLVQRPVITQKKKPRARHNPGAPDPTDVARTAVEAVKRCIDECADAYQRSSTKAQQGGYKADDLVSDMASMWARMMRDASAASDLGVTMTRVLTDQRFRPPPFTPGPVHPEAAEESR